MLKECISRLQRGAPGLYAVLSVHARRRFGKRLENLSLGEFNRLVEEFLPGRWELISAIMGLKERPFGSVGRARRERRRLAVVVVDSDA